MSAERPGKDATPLSVLVVEDSEDDARLVVRELERSGYAVTFERVETPAAMSQALARGDVDVVTSDDRMPHFSSQGALAVLKSSGLDIPFIIVSGSIGEDAAVEAMRSGADDYIMKDTLARLAPAVTRELAEAQTRKERAAAEHEFEAARERHAYLVEQSPMVVRSFQWGGGWAVTYMSENSPHLWGWEAREFLEDPELWIDNVHVEDLPGLLERRRSALASGSDVVEYRFRTKDGSWRWIRDEARVVTDDSGSPVECVGTCLDVTARKAAEAREAARFEVSHVLAAASTLGAAVPRLLEAICEGLGWDAGEVWGAERGASRLRWEGSWQRPSIDGELLEVTACPLEFAEGEGLPGRAWKKKRPVFFGKLDAPISKARLDAIHAAGFMAALACPILADGEVLGAFLLFRRARERPHEDVMRLMLDLGRQIGQFVERVRLDEDLRRKSLYDELTGLPNRALLMDRLTGAVRHAKKRQLALGVLVADLDRFKAVNESLGRDAGDELLIAVAERLGQCVRPDDTVARMGADEFVVLLDPIGAAEDALYVTSRIEERMAQPFTVRGREVYATVSTGIAFGGSECRRCEDLIRDADTAMHRAKAHGRGEHAIFDSRMHKGLLDRVQMETDLRYAIDRGEFVLHYQPTVDAHTGAMVRAEALVRWVHPKRGMIAPDEFMSIAEDTGLIVPMGAWVMKEACATAAGWNSSGSGSLSVAVNLSARQFRQEGLSTIIRTALEESGLSTDRLTVEVTESSVMVEPEKAAQILGELAGMGLSISLDDFGTGYSSLSYLKRFPISMLKVDRSFVSGLPADGDDAAITEAVIDLGHALDLRVTAEGVETEDQASFLRSHGCDEMQGYLYSRPLAPAAFEKLLAAPAPPWARSARGGRGGGKS